MFFDGKLEQLLEAAQMEEFGAGYVEEPTLEDVMEINVESAREMFTINTAVIMAGEVLEEGLLNHTIKATDARVLAEGAMGDRVTKVKEMFIKMKNAIVGFIRKCISFISSLVMGSKKLISKYGNAVSGVTLTAAEGKSIKIFKVMEIMREATPILTKLADPINVGIEKSDTDITAPILEKIKNEPTGTVGTVDGKTVLGMIKSAETSIAALKETEKKTERAYALVIKDVEETYKAKDATKETKKEGKGNVTEIRKSLSKYNSLVGALCTLMKDATKAYVGYLRRMIRQELGDVSELRATDAADQKSASKAKKKADKAAKKAEKDAKKAEKANQEPTPESFFGVDFEDLEFGM